MLSPTKVSEDNGLTWEPLVWKPDFTEGLPNGYRRVPLTAVRDSSTGTMLMVCNAMDTPGLNPLVKEPPIAQKSYYLRYRVSMDGEEVLAFSMSRSFRMAASIPAIRWM